MFYIQVIANVTDDSLGNLITFVKYQNLKHRFVTVSV